MHGYVRRAKLNHLSEFLGPSQAWSPPVQALALPSVSDATSAGNTTPWCWAPISHH